MTVSPRQRCITFWERIVMPQIWFCSPFDTLREVSTERGGRVMSLPTASSF